MCIAEKYFWMRNKLNQSHEKKTSRLKEDQGPKALAHTATQTTLKCPPPPVVSNHSVLPWITSCLLISLAVIFFKIYNWWRKQRLLVKWNFCRFLVMKLKQLRRRLGREISVKKGEALTNNNSTCPSLYISSPSLPCTTIYGGHQDTPTNFPFYFWN